MPHPESDEPQDRAVPTGASSRRKVQPLAPEPGRTSATSPPPPAPGTPASMPRGQRIIIGVGLAYCAFVWLSMALALMHRG